MNFIGKLEALAEVRPLLRLDSYLDYYQNLITCYFYHPKPLHKIHPNPVITFFNNVINRQTKKSNTTENMTFLAKVKKNLPDC